MSEVSRCEDVTPDVSDERTIWPVLYSAVVGRDLGAIGGIVAYNPSSEGFPLGPSHDTPELCYVIKGEGLVRQADNTFVVREGDTFVNRPGVRHSLWSTTDEPLLTFFVEVTHV